MLIYIIKDDDPYFGNFSAQDWMPFMEYERPSVSEVRTRNVTDAFWAMVVEEGGIPEDADHSNDSVWFGLYQGGDTVWVRPEPGGG